jgi:hypothetical protein
MKYLLVLIFILSIHKNLLSQTESSDFYTSYCSRVEDLENRGARYPLPSLKTRLCSLTPVDDPMAIAQLRSQAILNLKQLADSLKESWINLYARNLKILNSKDLLSIKKQMSNFQTIYEQFIAIHSIYFRVNQYRKHLTEQQRQEGIFAIYKYYNENFNRELPLFLSIISIASSHCDYFYGNQNKSPFGTKICPVIPSLLDSNAREMIKKTKKAFLKDCPALKI